MATGIATLNFGAFPGASHATVDAAAAGVVASSLIEAWVRGIATADHSVDEHMVETLKVVGVYLSDGNIRIHGFNTNQVVPPPTHEGDFRSGSGSQSFTHPRPVAPMIYGQWSVGWATV